MNLTYFVTLLIGAVLCAGLFSWKLSRAGLKPAAAWLTLPLAVLLGLAASKVVYFLLEFRDQFVTYGWAGLLTDRPKEFSFIGGALGVVLAVILVSRWARQPVWRMLDAFAPCGALMAAITRACEGLLDPAAMIGVGEFVENEAHWFFPVAVENAMFYSWFYAVFMMEALFALIVAVASFLLSHRGKAAPGRVFLHTAFYLALPQIFSERMLSQCMSWGFVRIEQLLCAVIVFAVILCACIRGRKRVSFIPAGLTLLCMAVVICIEFTLDNKPPFGIELPTTVCYILMVTMLGCMAALETFAYRKLNQQE